MLMLGGIALLVAEVFVTSFGILFALGVSCFLLGGAMLFDRPAESDLNVSFWSVLVPAVGAVAFFGAVVVFAVGRSLQRPSVSGVDELIGRIGVATTALEPDGTVSVRGEFWDARAEAPVAQGRKVEVVAVDAMRLRVRAAPPEA